MSLSFVAVAESLALVHVLPEMKNTGVFQFWFGPIPTVLLYSPEAVEVSLLLFTHTTTLDGF